MIRKYQTPSQTTHPDRQLYPMEDKPYRRLHGSNVLRLRVCTAFITPDSYWAIKCLIPMLQRLCCYGARK